MSLSSLIKEIEELKTDYAYVHQYSLDLIDSIIMEYDEYSSNIFSHDTGPVAEDFVSNILHNVLGLIEICDKDLCDYEVLLQLKEILNNYD